MPIIQDTITSLMGGGASDDWQSQLQPSSFRGVPFAVVNEEGSHGRRQAVHEYRYRWQKPTNYQRVLSGRTPIIMTSL